MKDTFDLINKYFVTFIAFALGLFFFYHQIEKPNLKTSDKVIFVEGKVLNYSFLDKDRLTKYYIWLDNYPCTFQIKADFRSNFKKLRFEKEIEKGDKINLAVPKELEHDLFERDRKIFILAAEKNSTNYLNLRDTIPKENNHFDIYAGFLFFIIGIFYFFLKNRKNN